MSREVILDQAGLHLPAEEVVCHLYDAVGQFRKRIRGRSPEKRYHVILKIEEYP